MLSHPSLSTPPNSFQTGRNRWLCQQTLACDPALYKEERKRKRRKEVVPEETHGLKLCGVRTAMPGVGFSTPGAKTPGTTRTPRSTCTNPLLHHCGHEIRYRRSERRNIVFLFFSLSFLFFPSLLLSPFHLKRRPAAARMGCRLNLRVRVSCTKQESSSEFPYAGCIANAVCNEEETGASPLFHRTGYHCWYVQSHRARRPVFFSSRPRQFVVPRNTNNSFPLLLLTFKHSLQHIPYPPHRSHAHALSHAHNACAGVCLCMVALLCLFPAAVCLPLLVFPLQTR